MTEPDLRDLLHVAAGDPPRDLDPDSLLHEAGRRRTTRWVAGAAGLGALAVVAAVAVPPLLTQRVARPATEPSMTMASPISSFDVEPGHGSIDQPCPTADPEPAGIGELVSMVLWHTTDYSGMVAETPVHLGESVFTVTCTIYEISKGGTHRVSTPWPSGTATFAPVGTPLRVIEGQDPACYLGAEFDGLTWVFRANKPDGSGMPEGCTPGFGPWAGIDAMGHAEARAHAEEQARLAAEAAEAANR